jgi:DNA-binding GntR family transcriptional regulator
MKAVEASARKSRSEQTEGALPLIKPRALYDRVYDGLRDRLMHGQLLPGNSISLRSIAAEFDVSPMPVRAAVSRLIAERALTLQPNRSIIVPHLSQREFRELSEARCALEGMVAEAAGQRVTTSLIADLRRINADLRKSIAARSVSASLDHNFRFHFRLYAASASTVLLPLIEALWLQVGPFLHLSMLLPETQWDARAHDDVLDALAERRADDVRRAVERDVRETAERLLKTGRFGA